MTFSNTFNFFAFFHLFTNPFVVSHFYHRKSSPWTTIHHCFECVEEPSNLHNSFNTFFRVSLATTLKNINETTINYYSFAYTNRKLCLPERVREWENEKEWEHKNHIIINSSFLGSDKKKKCLNFGVPVQFSAIYFRMQSLINDWHIFSLCHSMREENIYFW